MQQEHGHRTYRLNFAEDEHGGPRHIEFEAPSPNRAMSLMQTLCGENPVEIFEDDRRLGRIMIASAGYWIISG